MFSSLFFLFYRDKFIFITFLFILVWFAGKFIVSIFHLNSIRCEKNGKQMEMMNSK